MIWEVHCRLLGVARLVVVRAEDADAAYYAAREYLSRCYRTAALLGSPRVAPERTIAYEHEAAGDTAYLAQP